MRIAFLDTVLQYTTDTPYKSPLGGSQSALCYLAIELKRLGHAITIFNRLPGRNESAGIRIRHISEITVSGSLKTTLVPPSYVKLLDLTCPWCSCGGCKSRPQNSRVDFDVIGRQSFVMALVHCFVSCF